MMPTWDRRGWATEVLWCDTAQLSAWGRLSVPPLVLSFAPHSLLNTVTWWFPAHIKSDLVFRIALRDFLRYHSQIIFKILDARCNQSNKALWKITALITISLQHSAAAPLKKLSSIAGTRKAAAGQPLVRAGRAQPQAQVRVPPCAAAIDRLQISRIIHFPTTQHKVDESPLITSLLKGNHWSMALWENKPPPKADESRRSSEQLPFGTVPPSVPTDSTQLTHAALPSLKLSLAGVTL